MTWQRFLFLSRISPQERELPLVQYWRVSGTKRNLLEPVVDQATKMARSHVKDSSMHYGLPSFYGLAF